MHTGNEEEVNKKVFVYEQGKGWMEDTSIPLLPDGPVYCSSYLFASGTGDDNHLVVAYDSKLLVFDGQQWQQKDGPGCDMRVLIHCGILYLVIQENWGGSFCKVSMQYLLAENDYNWKNLMLKLPYVCDIKYSSLTVIDDHITMVASIHGELSRTLCVLSLSSTSNSWIGLTQLNLGYCGTPSIVGCPNGKLLLMGLTKTKDPRSQNLPSAATPRQFPVLAPQPIPQFKMIEVTSNGTYALLVLFSRV